MTCEVSEIKTAQTKDPKVFTVKRFIFLSSWTMWIVIEERKSTANWVDSTRGNFDFGVLLTAVFCPWMPLLLAPARHAGVGNNRAQNKLKFMRLCANKGHLPSSLFSYNLPSKDKLGTLQMKFVALLQRDRNKWNLLGAKWNFFFNFKDFFNHMKENSRVSLFKKSLLYCFSDCKSKVEIVVGILEYTQIKEEIH